MFCETEDQKRERQRKEILDKCRQQAESKLADLRLQQPATFEKFSAENERDKSAYEFRCERWGDFIALFIRRGVDIGPVPEWDSRGVKFYAGALNLGKSSEIKFERGTPVDWNGHIVFRVGRDYNAKDFEYRAVEEVPTVPGRQIIFVQLPATNSHGMAMSYCGSGNGLDINTRLDACARPSKDDEIKFLGPQATLYVPFGLGESVYAKILAAISAQRSPVVKRRAARR